MDSLALLYSGKHGRWGNSPPAGLCCGTNVRRRLKALVEAVRLEDLGVQWYSLRRGGATAFFMHTGSMEKTLLRGRWQSSATARLYLQDALAAVVDLQLGGAQVAFLRYLARLLGEGVPLS